MATIKKLQELASEINRDWDPDYRAIVQDGELRITHRHIVVAVMDQKFDLEMVEEGFEEVKAQIIYMVER